MHSSSGEDTVTPDESHVLLWVETQRPLSTGQPTLQMAGGSEAVSTLKRAKSRDFSPAAVENPKLWIYISICVGFNDAVCDYKKGNVLMATRRKPAEDKGHFFQGCEFAEDGEGICLQVSAPDDCTMSRRKQAKPQHIDSEEPASGGNGEFYVRRKVRLAQPRAKLMSGSRPRRCA
ncbi:unnamed protein product [Tetraodon nigroviridis]|uniref:(spotted green pufferfish) hypothetical protein n=1 Tax=Tetraodon nigroviridis TaxID=99883 RepID=Q4S660_TETNG|nr:unnamed protein product [Tetraodon nigroviridis]